MISLIRKLLVRYKRFMTFCIVGVINTLVTYIAYIILLFFGVHFTVANAIGDVAGGVNSYIWNKLWVFKDSGAKTAQSMPKFVITFLIYMFTSWLLMTLCVDVMGIPEKWAKLAVLPVTTVLNYVMNKIWTFAKKEKPV